LAFAAWETPAPERSEGERGGSHAAKASENKGREHVGRRSTLGSVTVIDAGGQIANSQFQDTIYYKIINPDYAL